VLVLSGTLRAQDIVGAGLSGVMYQHRVGSVRLAPGQVVTLFVQGLTGGSAAADRLPLPTSLVGTSVIFRQGTTEIPAPIFSIAPVLDSNTGQSGSLTAVTIQVPFEISVPRPDLGDPSSQLLISGGRPLALTASLQEIHAVGVCWPDFCPGVVTHFDGTLVSGNNPARPGEILVAYVVGLGMVVPTVKSGDPAPPAPLSRPFTPVLAFEFRFNARPAPFSTADQTQFQAPIFAGLVPGLVGLYQVNFRVPTEIPASVTVARGLCGQFPFFSNLTVTIQGIQPPPNLLFTPPWLPSFDGVGICVEP